LASLGWVFLLGPLLEEPGWRGYALDRLQTLGSAFTASVILGLLWAAWHLPQFFIPGSYHHTLGFWTLAFWLFVLTAISISVLITWIYRYNERSVFAAILLHASVNFTRDSVPLSIRTELIRTGLLILFAAIVLLRCRPDTLTKCR
jgi:membrane protease YdiL (CAAX protease family)